MDELQRVLAELREIESGHALAGEGSVRKAMEDPDHARAATALSRALHTRHSGSLTLHAPPGSLAPPD